MAYFYKQNSYLENVISEYFDKIQTLNNEKYNGSLSVLLLGSLSRGEATWIETQNGPLMVSDIEYFTIFPEGFTDFDGFQKESDLIAKQVFGNDRSSLFHIDNSFICENELSGLERKLLTYDAKIMGKTVVGPDKLPLFPEINLSNINLWDIKDILTHRVFSALYYGLALKKQKNEPEYRYNIAKNSLDLMTVLLVNHGILESGFIKRFEIIKTLDIDDDIKNYFEFCLSIKLSSECSFNFETSEMEKIFIKLVRLLKKEFRLPLKNLIVNSKAVIRRAMGIVKRALIYKKIPSFSHLDSLITSFENSKELTQIQKKNNLVLNGYPVE